MKPINFSKKGWRALLVVLGLSVALWWLWPRPPERPSRWVKFEGNPVLGGDLGTVFDLSLLKEGGTQIYLALGFFDCHDPAGAGGVIQAGGGLAAR